MQTLLSILRNYIFLTDVNRNVRRNRTVNGTQKAGIILEKATYTSFIATEIIYCDITPKLIKKFVPGILVRKTVKYFM